MSRKKELLLTIFSNLTLQFVTAVCGFILPPLIVKTFGSEINGLVSSITQFIAYLNLVEAGIGVASIAALYKPLAEEDLKKINGILSATQKFYSKSGIIFTFGILVLAFIFPFIAKTEIDRTISFFMVLILGISGSSEFFLIGKYRVFLTAEKKLYVISFIQSIAIIINTIVSVVLIKIGFGILIVKLASSLVYLSRFIFISFYVHKKYKMISYHEQPDTKEITQSKNAFIHQVSSFIVFNSPIIILTVICGLKEVSVYSVYLLIFTAISNIANAFTNGLQSFFGESLVKDSNEITRKFFSKYETLFFLLVFWLYSCTYVLIMPFMKLYTANMTDAEYFRPELAVLLIVAGILTNLRLPGGQMINAAGHFKKTQWRSITEAIINVVTSIFFTIKFGILGVALGNIISSFYRGIDIIVYTNKHILFQKSIFVFFKIILFSIVFGLLVFLFQQFDFEYLSWGTWLLNAVVCSVFMAVPILLVIILLKLKGKNKK